MAALTGNTVSSTYKSLLKTVDNDVVGSSLKTVTDGLGNATALSLDNNTVAVNGELVISGSLLYSGSTINATVTSASYALTASYALNGEATDTGSFATTGSNTFIGNQTVSGSVNVSGSISSNNVVVSPIFMIPQTIAEDVDIPSDYNAFLVGPVSFTGTVTVGTGSNLSIL